jgi:uncharacterized membrane protein
MSAALVVGALALGFVATHLGLASTRVRGALVQRLGEHGFLALYWIVAAVSFSALVVYYATHRFAGPAGPALGAVPVLRVLLLAVIVIGVALVPAALENYARSPTALFGQPIRPPRGIEQVTRHPFFMGIGLLALAHALLATRLVGTLFFAGLAVVAIAGGYHQDRKLRARRGAAYEAYLRATSVMPLAGVLTGRHGVDWRTLPLRALAAGVIVAVGLRFAHPWLLAGGGAGLIVAIVGGAVVATMQSWRRARRFEARARVTA